MALEDEMTLPYLVYRTWREYYDTLYQAKIFLSENKSEHAQTQLKQAEAILVKSKERLLQRGISPDDDYISDITAALSAHQAASETDGGLAFDLWQSILEQTDLRKTHAAEAL
jgi:hypothetical protein